MAEVGLRRARGSLREEQKRMTRQRLLDAALTVFAEKSFLDATMDDIAGAAGVARVTVYAHFPGKTEIIQALTTRVYDAMSDIFAALGALPAWTPATIRGWLDDTVPDWQAITPVLRVIHVEGAVALSVTDRTADAARGRYVAEHERYTAMLTADRERWPGVPESEARQRALTVVLHTRTILLAWLATGLSLGDPDPLDLLTGTVCQLLGPAVQNA
ncbi:TetR/AcrR family transcriptional regulator [Catenuloplanes japonicus]|uniref:TetR/AcrR family transcriptional regulator n=1 Tax=Catenuloplanes japonicus TaxID=33876 RepID=UPI00068B2F14|nr:TetR/AcrR family transcriptional regulator [Catenuloplanes japonicus]